MRRRLSTSNEMFPVMESLEPRQLLSGAVSVAVLAGKMTITGDGLANDIVVTNNGANSFAVTSGVNPTTINGTANPTGVTGDIIVNMLGGNDTVRLNGLPAAKNVSLNGGDGNNDLTIESPDITGNLTITNGLGDDDLHILTGGRVGGNVKITDGDGESNVTINGTFVIGGSISVAAGDGQHSDTSLTGLTVGGSVVAIIGDQIDGSNLDLSECHVSGGVTCTFGNNSNPTGGDMFYVADSTVNGAVKFSSGPGPSSNYMPTATFGGTYTATCGAGSSNYYDFESVVFNKGVTLTSAALDNDVTLKSVRVFGNLAYIGGLGGDSLDESSSQITGNFTWTPKAGGSDMQATGFVVGGNATFNGSPDVESITLGGSIGKNLTLNFGGGHQSIGLSALMVGGKLTTTTGDGIDTVTASIVTIVGGTVITASGGNNAVTINDCAFLGGLTLSCGEGVDTVNIDRSDTAANAPTIAHGKVLIGLGGGNDTINIGLQGVAERRFVVSGPCTLDGGTGVTTQSIQNLDSAIDPVFKNIF